MASVYPPRLPTYRGFNFVFHGAEQKDEIAIKALPYKYLIYVRFNDPDTGVVVVSGYVYFTNRRHVSTVQKYFSWQVYAATEDVFENRLKYYEADGYLFEDGQPAITSQAQHLWLKRVYWIRMGLIEAEDPKFYFLHYPLCRNISNDFKSDKVLNVPVPNRLPNGQLNPRGLYGPVKITPELCKFKETISE